MPMSPEEIANARRHPSLMDPAADPEELIESLIWWYPSLFPHRTAVLQSILRGGAGYEWGQDGQLRSVFAHVEPDYSTLGERKDRFRSSDDPGKPDLLEDFERRDLERSAQVRATFRERARTRGSVVISRGYRDDDYYLLTHRPSYVQPRWQALLDEAEQVFAEALAVQKAAEARLRQQWDRNPAARAAQLLTGQLGHAWAADDVTDAELAACDQALAAWRRPGWPSLLDHDHLRHKRDENRRQRELVRQILRVEADEKIAADEDPGPRPPRTVRDVLLALADDRIMTLHGKVRPVPYTGWHEWDWTRDLIGELLPVPETGGQQPGQGPAGPGPRSSSASRRRQVRPGDDRSAELEP